MSVWNEIITDKDLTDFLELYDGFHDCCLKELRYISGAFVGKDLSMNPVNTKRKLSILFNVFRRLRTQSVRNKKPPALRVGNKRLYQKTHLSVTIKLFKLIVKKRKVSKMANKTNSLSSTTWMCKYHIVFIPKYRRKAIYGQYRESLQEIIRTLCRYKGVEILEGHMMPDHVHLLLSIPPKMSVSSFMGYLKEKSALMMFDKHANLKYKFGNRHFWAEGYYVSTVGLNEATIRKYISDQEKHDIAMDRLSVKEYEDPFKGSR